ncbi:phosphatase PAP2 family protein [Galbibacter mesophilus]|uniref:phosphatase PAP2 family protein n=1 Tax=Galbibacter mesophilus TaxID=379069 RepID=UPI001F5C8691|nr:phosphatase PAP2 family protein [Galbibacter mesophilus]MCM5662629.1 phosphatase PAP2 family protein [Galbibacter mesophilus]
MNYKILFKKMLWIAFFFIAIKSGRCQTPQGLTSNHKRTEFSTQFRFSSVILPASLIGYGFWANHNRMLKELDYEIKEEVDEHIDEKLTIDDFSQYLPAASVYALNFAGIKGKNNLKDRTMILATAYLIMGGSVLGLKSLTKIERPDGSSNTSFPSGHTATAFMGAEFLYQEYKHKSIWYGVAGYAVAAGTGFFRMYNDRHWLSDVIAGAGIGILSTKIAYWLQPTLQSVFFPDRENDSEFSVTTSIAPFYDGNAIGVGAIIRF